MGKSSEVPEVLDRIFDAFGQIEPLRAFSKSGCKVKAKLENVIKMRSIPGNGRKEDSLSAVYNGLVEVLFLF